MHLEEPNLPGTRPKTDTPLTSNVCVCLLRVRFLGGFQRRNERNPAFWRVPNKDTPIWLWVKTNGTILGWCTTHFSRDFSGDWDVHWAYGILTHGHMVFFAWMAPQPDFMTSVCGWSNFVDLLKRGRRCVPRSTELLSKTIPTEQKRVPGVSMSL